MSQEVAQQGRGAGVRGTVDRLAGTLRVDAAAELRRCLTGVTLGLQLFETLTGLSICLHPFSRFNEFSVLVHTVLSANHYLAWSMRRVGASIIRSAVDEKQLQGARERISMVALGGCIGHDVVVWKGE